jgi:hypothetical protein
LVISLDYQQCERVERDKTRRFEAFPRQLAFGRAQVKSGGSTLHRFLVLSAFCALIAAPGLVAQSASSDLAAPAAQQGGVSLSHFANPQHSRTVPAFSQIGLSGGISTLGLNMQAAVNANRYLNIRGVGNFLKFTDNGISTSGFTAAGTLNFATGGVSVDYYPFPRHGLRLSPGVNFYNQSMLNASMVAAGGTSFTLNDTKYYASKAIPVTGVASLALNKQKISPTASIGWGNIIPRNGGHWSFPVEVGAAYVGNPQLGINLISGQVCQDPSGTIGCQNVVGDATLTSNLQAQVAKYQKDLKPLRFHPLFSFGVGYSFRIRSVE